eukprot:Colp12_sorted_trinity150504_noHs@32337
MSWRPLLSKNLHELRIHVCQNSSSSQGLRDFVRNNYVELKKANPTFPILVRECEGVEPRILARYDYGVEKMVTLQDKSEKEVAALVEQLVKAGESINKGQA